MPANTGQMGRPGGTPRLLERYRTEIAPALRKALGQRNVMEIPRLKKIVVNVGCGQAAHDAKVLEAVQKDLALITGQRPLVTRAKQAISNFKIRKGDPVGCKVTLRRSRMYEFFDRLVNIALPRIRDFQGLSLHGFDRGGNYTFGLQEHTIFPEMELYGGRPPMGMDISIVTSGKTRDEALALLKEFGVPFVKPRDEAVGHAAASAQGNPPSAHAPVTSKGDA